MISGLHFFFILCTFYCLEDVAVSTSSFHVTDYVPSTLLNVPTYCIDGGSGAKCFTSCMVSIDDDKDYVCIFLKSPGSESNAHFVNIDFAQPNISVKVDLFLPNRLEDTVRYYCNLNSVNKDLCFQEHGGLYAVAKLQFETMLKALTCKFHLSGFYRGKSSTSIHFFLNSFPRDGMKDTNAFVSVVVPPSSLDLHANNHYTISKVRYALDKILCKQFYLENHLCSVIKDEIKRIEFDHYKSDLLLFKPVHEVKFHSKNFDLLGASAACENMECAESRMLRNLYGFCLENTCDSQYFASVRSFLSKHITSIYHPKSMLDLGLSAGTDKIFWHGYQRLYRRHLEPYRKKPIRLLEIGLRDGASLELWSNYLHKDSEIYGIDYGSISPTCQPCKIRNAFCFHGDQQNRTFLRDVLSKTGANFDIIIDDGGHGYEQQLVSFEVLFHHGLRPGGIYFIEDIETSYWTDYEQYGNVVRGGKNHPNAPLSMFMQMVHVINREFHNHSDQVLFPLDRLVESISFSHNIIEITKLHLFPSIYDNRQYRYRYTMDKYGKDIPQIPKEYIIPQRNHDLVSESIGVNFIDSTSTTMDQSTNNAKRVLLKWNRFTLGSGSQRNAIARLCLNYAQDRNERKSCIGRLVNLFAGRNIGAPQSDVQELSTKIMSKASKLVNTAQKEIESSPVKCMLLEGGIEHMCYVPRICRSKGRWAFTDREGGLPDQLLKLLPTQNIKIVPYASTSRFKELHIDNSIYVGRGVYGFAHAVQDFFPAFSLSTLADRFKIPVLGGIIMTSFSSESADYLQRSHPWLYHFLSVFANRVDVFHGLKEFDEIEDGICFNGIFHGDISGKFTWERTGWRNPIDWFQSSAIPKLIANEIGGSCVTSRYKNKPKKPGGVIFLQRINKYRHFVGPEQFLTHFPFEKNQSVEIVTFENTDLCYQMQSIAQADIVIAPHGAGLTNIIFANDKSAILELFPYNYYVPGFYGALALQSGLTYAAWYNHNSSQSDKSCMKMEWIRGGPDICHKSGECRACARNVNMTITNEKQLEEVLFTFAQLMRLHVESKFKNVVSTPSSNPYYMIHNYYGWIPFHSKYAFVEERTDTTSPFNEIFRNIAVEGIVGDIVHFGRGNVDSFLSNSKLYAQAYNLHHAVRICLMEFTMKDSFCLYFDSNKNTWEEDATSKTPEGCISLLHINVFTAEMLRFALDELYTRVSIGGYIHVGGEGKMKKANSIQFHLYNFVREHNLESVTSIRKYVNYRSTSRLYHLQINFRRWSVVPDIDSSREATKNRLKQHWCSYTHACRKSLQYFIYGAFSIDSDSVLLQRELCYNQFNVTHYGGGKRKELRLYNTGSGIGSYIHFLSTAMGVAIDRNRFLTSVKGNDNYASFHNYTNCKNEDLSCYFKPLFKSLSRKQNQENISGCQPFLKDTQHHSQNAQCLYLSYSRVIALGQTTPFQNGFERITEYIPAKYKHRGILWWRSQLQYFALQPNNRLFLAIIFAKLTLDIRSNFVAVHVRHGDKATETATFHFDKYMPGIRHLSNAHGTRNIFISTEDQAVIDALHDYPEYSFKYTRGHKRHNIAIEEAFKKKITTPEIEAYVAFKNLFISMCATSFLGTFTSNWSRLVYELMYAHHGSEKTEFISLDIGYTT